MYDRTVPQSKQNKLKRLLKIKINQESLGGVFVSGATSSFDGIFSIWKVSQLGGDNQKWQN